MGGERGGKRGGQGVSGGSVNDGNMVIFVKCAALAPSFWTRILPRATHTPAIPNIIIELKQFKPKRKAGGAWYLRVKNGCGNVGVKGTVSMGKCTRVLQRREV